MMKVVAVRRKAENREDYNWVRVCGQHNISTGGLYYVKDLNLAESYFTLYLDKDCTRVLGKVPSNAKSLWFREYYDIGISLEPLTKRDLRKYL